LIWLPLASALVALVYPKRFAPRVVLVGAVATLGIAIGYLASFDPAKEGQQFVTDTVWISDLGIHYKLALDGLNVALVLLAALVFAAAILAANFREWERSKLLDRKSTRLNSSHVAISYAVFCLKKKNR